MISNASKTNIDVGFETVGGCFFFLSTTNRATATPKVITAKIPKMLPRITGVLLVGSGASSGLASTMDQQIL